MKKSKMDIFHEKSIYGGSFKSCLNCNNFDETKEECKLAGSRPPAKIIVFGCESHELDDIPF